jgi:hypothetical protein
MAPRFSVRTLAIFVTLVCVYFATWEATKKHGPQAVVLAKYPELAPRWVEDFYLPDERAKGSVAVPMPFVVTWLRPIPQGNNLRPPEYTRDYYLWFNGWTTRVPPQKTELTKHPEKNVNEIYFTFKLSR